MKKCPFCAEEIQDEAIKCKHCGEMIRLVAGVNAPVIAHSVASPEGPKQPSQAKQFGVVVAAVGVAGMVNALRMDVSVQTSMGAVNNIGLMNDRQSYLICAAVAILVGVVMAMMGGDAPIGSSRPVLAPAAPREILRMNRKEYTLAYAVAMGGGIMVLFGVMGVDFSLSLYFGIVLAGIGALVGWTFWKPTE